MEMTTGYTRWTIMYIWFSRHNRNVTNAKIRIERSKHQCQIGVEDGGCYIPVLGIGLHVTMVENSSDPRLVLYMWKMASGVLLSTNISLAMSTVKFSVNMHFFVGHVSCLRILIVILKNNKLRTLWFLHRMRPYGQMSLRLCLKTTHVSNIPQGNDFLFLLYNLQLTLNFAHFIIFIKIFARNKLL